MNFYQIDNIFSIQEETLFINNNKKYLFNLNGSNEDYDTLELLVNSIATFHLTNLKQKKEDVYVEFYIKSENEDKFIHFLQYDEIEKKNNKKYIYPFFSCLTYLNDNFSQILFTDISNDDYKYKNFSNQTKIVLSLPIKGKHIVFDGEKYVSFLPSSCNLEESNFILIVNIWETKPNIPYYKKIINNDNILINEYNKKIPLFLKLNQSINELSGIDISNEDFFEMIFYNQSYDDIKNVLVFKNDETNDKNKNIFIYNLKKIISEKELIFNEVNDIKNKMYEIQNNRFLKEFSFKSNFGEQLNMWIINESENFVKKNNGWCVKNSILFLPLKNITTVFRFFSFTLQNIFDNIYTNYKLDKECKLNISEITIQKYVNIYSFTNEVIINNIDFIKFYILLNSDFKGGNILFSDGSSYQLKKDEVFVHCNQMNYKFDCITEGYMYLIIGYINIF